MEEEDQTPPSTSTPGFAITFNSSTARDRHFLPIVFVSTYHLLLALGGAHGVSPEFISLAVSQPYTHLHQPSSTTTTTT